jgi:hypothetical protein
MDDAIRRENPLDREFDLGELEKAVEWVKRVFSRYIFEEPQAVGPPVVGIMEYDHVISQKDAELQMVPVMGRCRMPAGTRLRHWITVTNFAKLFFDVIMDGTIPYDWPAPQEKKATDKIAFIIAQDERLQLGHSRFLKEMRREGKI